MGKWLGLLAVLPLGAATAAHAQSKGLAIPEIVSIARNHQLDLRVSQQQGNERPLPLMRGMIVHQDVAPNAIVGLGLANLYGRRRNGSSARLGDLPARSRKPALTFVMKF